MAIVFEYFTIRSYIKL